MRRNPPHILLVEDEPAHAKLVRRSLSAHSPPYELTVVTRLSEVPAALETLTPDLLLVDLFLPDGHGVELVEELASQLQFPIVILTSHGDERWAVDAIKAGALDYVVKSAEILADMPHVVDRGLREWDLVAEQQRMEQQLDHDRNLMARVQRISSMGEMAGSIAHEINQPLFTIVNFANAARNFLGNGTAPDVKALKECHEAIAEQASRAGEIIRRMREFVSQSPLQKEAWGILTLVEEAIAFIEPEARNRGFRVDFHSDGMDSPVYVDRIQIQQVIVNLLQNAIEAIEAANLDNSEAGAAEPRQPRITVIKKEETNSVKLEVSDDGVGISPELRLSLFEPFVTTRPQGMGMGLAICRSIIESHGGVISGRRNSERGSTFQFNLPIHSEEG